MKRRRLRTRADEGQEQAVEAVEAVEPQQKPRRQAARVAREKARRETKVEKNRKDKEIDRLRKEAKKEKEEAVRLRISESALVATLATQKTEAIQAVQAQAVEMAVQKALSGHGIGKPGVCWKCLSDGTWCLCGCGVPCRCADWFRENAFQILTFFTATGVAIVILVIWNMMPLIAKLQFNVGKE